MGLCGADSVQNGHRSPERQDSEFRMGKANANHIPIRPQDCEATNPFGEGGDLLHQRGAGIFDPGKRGR